MDPCNFINKAISHTPEMEIHTRPKLYHFGRYLVKPKLFRRKCFVPVTELECSYGKIFIPVTEISVAKTEISVTGPARPLIWTHRYFYKEKSGEARSRKPSQPGWPGSFEEALSDPSRKKLLAASSLGIFLRKEGYPPFSNSISRCSHHYANW